MRRDLFSPAGSVRLGSDNPLGCHSLPRPFKSLYSKEKTEYQGPGIEIFKGKNIKDARRKNSLIGKQLGGLKSSPKKKVTLKNTETEEVKTFDSKGEAMNYINVSTKSFSKIMKGLTVKNRPWVLPNDFVRDLSRDISTLLQ